MSAFMSMARARASFIFQPPEREATAEASISSVKPTDASTRLTSSLGGAVAAESAGSVNTKSSTASSAWDASMSCSTYTVRSSSLDGNPSSWPLAIARISVDFPHPLAPHRPYRDPRLRRRRALLSRILPPYASENSQLQRSTPTSSSSSSAFASAAPSHARRNAVVTASALAPAPPRRAPMGAHSSARNSLASESATPTAAQ